MYEFIRIAASKGVCQSWLLGPWGSTQETVCDEKDASDEGPTTLDQSGTGNGYTVKSPEIFIATPIDPLFLVLPAFLSQSPSTKPPDLNHLFLSIEDLLESLGKSSKHAEQTLSHELFRQTVEARIVVICDTVEAGDEKMYRLNLEKLLEELLLKTKKIVKSGLPASIEEKFVRKALEAPVIVQSREQSSFSQATKASQEEITVAESAPLNSAESQSSSTTVETTISISSAVTEVTIPEIGNSGTTTDEVRHLLRLRTAFSYIVSAYLPSFIANALTLKLASPASPIDFTPLNNQLAHLASLKAQALALRSLSDFSRKRSANDGDDEAVEARAEKKRKEEEEDKRKKAWESRGVRDLKKVNVTGMKKMSDFFGKVDTKAK